MKTFPLMRYRQLLLTASLMGLGSCGGEAVELLRKDVQTLKLELTTLRAQSKLGWKTALCSRDARLLLAAVQAECESGTCDLDIPPQNLVHLHVCNRDPKRRERFLDILSRQEREVFYLYSNSRELSQESNNRLKELVVEAKPLPTTRFLVVSRPWDREPDKRKHAESRGQVVQKEILSLLSAHFKSDPTSPEAKEPESAIRKRRTLLWVYEFPLIPPSKGKVQGPNLPPLLKPYDGPTSPTTLPADASANDERGVWVFRVDC